MKGVTISSPVYIDGFKVGLVRDITYDYDKMDKITVDISLEDEMRINKGSYITIVNSFLGGSELHIHLNKYVNEYLKPGDEIEATHGGRDDAVCTREDITQRRGDVAKDRFYFRWFADVDKPSGIGTIAQPCREDNREFGNFNSPVEPTIGQRRARNCIWIEDHYGEFLDVSSELKTLDLQTTVESINATLASLKVTTEKFNSTDNSIGLLLNDRALYDNLNSTADNASKLLLDLREHPKRYVHFSVF